METATAVVLGASAVGNLAATDDRDCFVVNPSGPARLAVSLVMPGGGYLYRLDARDSFGILLGSWFAPLDLRDTWGTIVVPGGNPVYFSVERGFNWNGGDYTLSVSDTPLELPPEFESEGNGDAGSADQLTDGRQMAGNLSSAGDVDQYRIHAEGSGVLALSLGNVGAAGSLPGGELVLTVRNGDGVVLGSWADVYPQSRQVVITEAGDYYVSVAAGSPLMAPAPYPDWKANQYGITATFVGEAESEPNGDMGSADGLLSGRSVAGSLSDASDSDVFVLAVPQAGNLSIHFDGPLTGSGGFSVAVKDGGGQVLSRAIFVGDRDLGVSVPGGGAYYVEVSADSVLNTHPYTVTAEFSAGVAGTFEREPDDDAGSAMAIGIDSVVHGVLGSAGDQDWYVVHATASGAFSIGGYPGFPAGGFRVSVFDGSGGLLVESAGTFLSSMGFNAGGPGDFFVRVEGFSGAYWSAEQYAFAASFTPGLLAVESEPNDVAEAADALVAGRMTYGVLPTSADVDHYAFTATGAGAVDLHFDHPGGGYAGAFFVTATDGTGTTLAGWGVSGADRDLVLWIPAGGTYDFAVTRDDYAGVAQYGLSATYGAGSFGDFESESNDTLETADMATTGVPIIGRLPVAAEKDCYAIAVGGEGVLSVAVDYPAAGLANWTLKLYDDAFDPIGQWSVLGDGTFQVNVGHAGTYFATLETGVTPLQEQYRLTLSATESERGQFESGDNGGRGTATPFAAANPIFGHFSSSADTDWYAVTVEHGASLTIAYGTPDGVAIGANLALFDAAGNLLGSWSETTNHSFPVDGVGPGTYYLSL
ncbi:MAG TPA: PPC domain-containing protein, partial [Rhodocyclaceae bacterium]|nr:PPC domain-containing protein [Rhodocyclaceae bacterium]